MKREEPILNKISQIVGNSTSFQVKLHVLIGHLPIQPDNMFKDEILFVQKIKFAHRQCHVYGPKPYLNDDRYDFCIIN